MGFLAAIAVPVVLWHAVIADIAAAYHLDLRYLVTGWTPWLLMALGLCCFVPVFVEHLRTRDDRFYRSGTGAWVGWGVTLYLLGFLLASQVAQIHHGLTS